MITESKLTLNTLNPNKRRVMSIRLSEELLELLSQGKEKSIKIQFGTDQKIRVGNASFDYNKVDETQPVEIYQKNPSSENLEVIGYLTHKLTVRREMGDKTKERAASRMDSRKSVLLNKDNKEVEPQKMRRPPQLKSAPITTRRLAPTSTTQSLASLVTSKDGGKPGSSIPLRTRILQLLAINPMSQGNLAMTMKVPKDELIKTLNSVATVTGDIWSLKDDSFKEVKIKDWEAYSSKEKETVSLNALKAFDSLNLPSDAPERSGLILPPKPESEPTPDRDKPKGAAEMNEEIQQKDYSRRRIAETPKEAPSDARSTTRGTSSKPSSLARSSSNVKETSAENTPTPTTRKPRAPRDPSSLGGYRIPKKTDSRNAESGEISEKEPLPASKNRSNGSAVETNNSHAASTGTARSDHASRKHPVRVYVVKTSIEYHDLVALFQVKNMEYQSLNEKIHAKKPQLERLAEQARKSVDSEKQELAADIMKLRCKEISRWADEFTELHYDLEAISKELSRASEQGLAD
ncbi:hypothetical protein K493DRAFT_310004 [Basidiobolus meristosporus CBS 931.73]|uniref:RNA polymerase II elongation factor ELL N-terminal domain-containing protein n=1 Tax=Basidiobolus meristosporus CBS 931.73 TaxID=1314790 RepID=A0A1Y1ZCK9_9FUNG|nr:hypothetical protein K493DRAFT_310004 [Basidiobolus meristosporus CBS 931.73]|eukprot:ORY07991.1 hypothetical protein K493DRAFT_310004 [Basidiobolus meristosporus CBS 931.73]